MKRIALIHPHLIPGGGSEAAVLQAAEALADSCEVSILSMGEIDLEALDQAYGTSVCRLGVKLVGLPFAPLLRDRFDALKAFPLIRYCRRVASQYQALISTYNPMDFGRPGIQLIADYSFDDELRRTCVGDRRNASAFRKGYVTFARLLSGGTTSGWKRNWTVSNSIWTRRIMADHFGVDSEVLYPPVEGGFPAVPWSSREDGFVVLGRVSPEKNIERAFEIVGGARALGHDFHLHIVGRAGDPAYTRRIRDLCRIHDSWANWEGSLFGLEKKEFLARHKYGLSCRDFEPFGIAVAEMVKAGCLVWVPAGGGQVEIVQEAGLTYATPEEAALKIHRLVSAPALIGSLRERLAQGAERFSVNAFRNGIQDIVQRFFRDGGATT